MKNNKIVYYDYFIENIILLLDESLEKKRRII